MSISVDLPIERSHSNPTMQSDPISSHDSRSTAPLLSGRVKAGLPSSRFLSVDVLAPSIRKFVDENAKICQPSSIYVCDGSEEENKRLIETLEDKGRLLKLTKYDNW